MECVHDQYLLPKPLPPTPGISELMYWPVWLYGIGEVSNAFDM